MPIMTSTRESLLAKISEIQSMEPGKLCIIRQGPDGPYYNLQYRQEGKTVTHYVPREQVESAQTNTANFRQFQNLVDEYAQLVGDQSRAVREGQTQKKTKLTSSSRKTRKSTS